MSEITKKDDERTILNWLIHNHTFFDLHWVDEEPPDFSAILDGRRIGLEVTRFHHKDERVTKENIVRKVRELCIKKLADIKPAPSHVEVTCNYEKWPIKHNRQAVSDAIVKTLSEKYSGFPIEITGEDLPEILRQVSISKIRATTPDDFGRATHWQFPQFSFLKKHSVDHLQEIVSKKNLSRDQYKDRFDDTWLLIVTQKFGASSFVDYLPREIELASSFDRTFIFQYSTTELIEITRTRNDASQ
jgi:hypothetical protein